jgi:hypothetical protein
MTKTKPRFTNRIYRAELSHTPAGSPIIKIVPLHPTWPSGGHRQIAAFVYDLASAMELRSEALGTRPQWVISPEASNARVILELGSRTEAKAADEFIAKVLLDRNLD